MKKKIRLFLLIFIITILNLSAENFLFDNSKLQKGDTGYGLTVFNGDIPETFLVKVIGVLPNALPKMDMILIRLLDKRLEHTGVVAGMSGSPIYIYIKGKPYLIGALAYGWAYSKDPIAGVTPIKNMLDVFKYKPDKKNIDELYNYSWNSKNNYGLKKIAAPLMISGISDYVLNKYKDKLLNLGFIPVTGGNKSENQNDTEKINIVNGGVIGAQLARGDIDYTALGTITYVDKKNKQLLAFGHPFMRRGYINLPVTTGKILTFLPSVFRSFKIGYATKEIGSLEQDLLPAISAKLDKKVKMLPFTINVDNHLTNKKNIWKTELIKEPSLTPLLLLMSVSEALYSSEVYRKTTVYTKLNIKFEGFPEIILKNILTSKDLNDYIQPLMPLLSFIFNPFKEVKLKKINLDFDIQPGYKELNLIKVITDKQYYKKNDNINFTLIFSKYNQTEKIVKNINFKVPDDLSKGAYVIYIMPSNNLPLLDTKIENMQDLYNRTKKFYPENYLSVILFTNKKYPQINSFKLYDLPAYYKNVLKNTESRKKKNIFNNKFYNKNYSLGDNVITGYQKIFLTIKE